MNMIRKKFSKKKFLNLEGGAGLAGYLIIKRIIYVSKPCVCVCMNSPWSKFPPQNRE